ncbi:MAG TPA: UbiD family decarboxylase [Nitrososphaera sp.]|nr:UbiD family decarboxylase [Nitrososphaera sp.]
MKDKTADNSSTSSSSKINSPDFRGFLSLLEGQGQLARVRKDVGTKFELAAVTSKLDGKEAVVFSKVRNSKFAVAANVCGTPERFYLAISGGNPAKVDQNHNNNNNNIKTAIHSRITEALGRLSAPRISEAPASFEKNSSASLADLPVVTHFEKDAGPFITSSIVYTKDQEKGNQNSSTHRLLLLDDRHMAIRMVEGRHLHKCYSHARDHGEDLKVAITIGVHPAVSIAAAYQAAYGVDEMQIASSLLGYSGLTVSRAPGSGLYVPSHAEIVIEGRILRDRTQEEWMVEMLRTYDHRRKQPVFELDRIRYRDNAVYHDVLPGYAEHRLLMGLPVEAKILDYVKNVVPTTKSVHLSDGGCNWLAAVIQIKKRLEGEPKNAIFAAFAAHPSLKTATVVDDDIDPTDATAVEYAVITRCQADRGFVIVPNVKGSSLDPSSDQTNLLTTKLGIDATATLQKPKERFEIAIIPGQGEIDLRDYLEIRKEIK